MPVDDRTFLCYDALVEQHLSATRTAISNRPSAKPRPTARQSLGAAGERLAAEHLRQQGYTILETNWRSPGLGELDMVAREGEALAFVEVRTRRGRAYGTPEESITPRKQAKLAALAETYLQEHPPRPLDWRIDVVAVEMSAEGRLLRVEIIRNAVGDQS